jgi:Ribonuclease G/E
MTRRRLFIDEGPGETRGAVFLNGAPERLFLERAAEPERHPPGTILIGRVRKISAVLKSAFIDLGGGLDGLLPLTATPPPPEGAALKLEVITGPRRDKGAVLRLLGADAGPPRLLAAAPSLRARLELIAPGAVIETGKPARQAADQAEAEAHAVSRGLKGGGFIHVEPTRALIAVDVDLGGADGDPRRAAARVNLAAIEACARILRLKRLGGLVAIDLVGKGHDGARLLAAARTAFAPDGEGVVFGPISRFGVFELAAPRDAAPLSDLFLGEDGQETIATRVYRLLRSMESAAGPGLHVRARCGVALYDAALPFHAALQDRIGARFHFEATADAPANFYEVIAQ